EQRAGRRDVVVLAGLWRATGGATGAAATVVARDGGYRDHPRPGGSIVRTRGASQSPDRGRAGDLLREHAGPAVVRRTWLAGGDGAVDSVALRRRGHRAVPRDIHAPQQSDRCDRPSRVAVFDRDV